MKTFLLDTIKHDLVDRFSEEALPEPYDSIFWVCFIQNLNVVSLFKTSEDLKDLFVSLMPQRADMLKNSGADYFTNYSGRFQD